MSRQRPIPIGCLGCPLGKAWFTSSRKGPVRVKHIAFEELPGPLQEQDPQLAQARLFRVTIPAPLRDVLVVQPPHGPRRILVLPTAWTRHTHRPTVFRGQVPLQRLVA